MMMKLAIFDLDYTLWQPEMYQLRGPPMLKSIADLQKQPQKQSYSQTVLQQALTTSSGKVLVDKNGWLMQMFDGARFALDDIQRMQREGNPIRAAVASKTDEPEWAYVCMQHMCLSDGKTSLLDFFGKNTETIEISYGDKTHHIRRLHTTTGIPFNEMAFFDNEHWNIKDVQNNLPDVKCYYTPGGMTKEAWQDALKDFNMES